MTAPVLAFPDQSKSLIIYWNVIYYCTGTVLSQEHKIEGKIQERPTAYVAYQFSLCSKNISPIYCYLHSPCQRAPHIKTIQFQTLWYRASYSKNLPLKFHEHKGRWKNHVPTHSLPGTYIKNHTRGIRRSLIWHGQTITIPNDGKANQKAFQALCDRKSCLLITANAIIHFRCSAIFLECWCTFTTVIDCFKDISRPLHCLPFTKYILLNSWIVSDTLCTFTRVIKTFQDYCSFILCGCRI